MLLTGDDNKLVTSSCFQAVMPSQETKVVIVIEQNCFISCDFRLTSRRDLADGSDEVVLVDIPMVDTLIEKLSSDLCATFRQ